MYSMEKRFVEVKSVELIEDTHTHTNALYSRLKQIIKLHCIQICILIEENV